MYTGEEQNLITLSSFAELSYKQRDLLISQSENGTPDFVKFQSDLIKSVGQGVYNKIREHFFDPAYRNRLFDGLEQRGIVCITSVSENYPINLKNTPCPPQVLYCKGNINLLKTRRFAVVGARKTLPNVIKECKKISGGLTEHFTIVTGTADGADAAAIQGAAESGKIISVLAHGFNYFYPAHNENLIKEAAAKGLIISEFPPYVSPQAYYFPVRNRIIAGLCEGVLVVSAGAKSGALITAGYAAEYGRDVFAFPYGIGVKSGEGCNSLIKKGACLAESALDIFSAYGLDCKPSGALALTEAENQLLAIVREQGEAFAPYIAERLGKQPYQIIPLLSSLEIKGLIVRMGGNRYSVI